MVTTIADVWYEILVRLDPYSIFNCILVCKEWLEWITSREFQRSYQKRWKTNSKLVGLISRWPNELKLLPTSELGRIIDANKSKSSRRGFFVSKSGDGFILFGILSFRPYLGLYIDDAAFCLYVSKIGESRPVKLPQPPRGKRWAAPAILSRRPDSSSYKVILITYGQDNNGVDIHTFSPSTAKWETFNQKMDIPLVSSDETNGIVSSSRGLVYWPWPDENRVGMYDDNKQENPISWIDGPSQDYEQEDKICNNYCLSSQGHLLRATSYLWSKCCKIWLLGDDNKVWKMLHDVRMPRDVTFVSFLPATYHSIVVKSVSLVSLPTCDSKVVKHDPFPAFSRRNIYKQHFVYNLGTGELDKSSPPFNCGAGEFDPSGFHRKAACLDWTPLTVADLGVWPSSPFSNSTKTNNIHGIKYIMDPFVPLSAWSAPDRDRSHQD